VVGEPRGARRKAIQIRGVEFAAAVAAEQVSVQAVQQHHDSLFGSQLWCFHGLKKLG
jgi:hypothetical protein